MYDLLNSTTLTQKIFVSSIFSVIKILTIEDHKFYDNFFYVVFWLQSLLNSTSDQTDSDTNWKTG
jgi:hypothetical protein